MEVFLLPPTVSGGDGDGPLFCVSLPHSPPTGESLIISDNQDEAYLIITINDTSLGYLPLIINISDTYKNQPKRLDFDNSINLSSLIVILAKYDSIPLTVIIFPLTVSPLYLLLFRAKIGRLTE